MPGADEPPGPGAGKPGAGKPDAGKPDAGDPGAGKQGGGEPGGAVDAVVLAGGRGARLGGVDKPALVVGERSLIAAVVSAARAVGAHRVVIVGPDRPGLGQPESGQPESGQRGSGQPESGPPGPGQPGPGQPGSGQPGPGQPGSEPPTGGLCVVREDPPGGGPVPALRRGLAEVSAPWVLLLAADLPFLRARYLGSLLASVRRDGAAGGVLADEAGRPQWLAGCWRTAALRRAAGGYRGASLHGLLGPLRPVLLRPAPGEPGPPPWLDCDTPEDVRLARRWSVVQDPARDCGPGGPA